MTTNLPPVPTRKATVLDYIGAGCAFAALFVLRRLPFQVVSWLGGGLARTIGPWLKPSRTARKNLAAVFPDMAPAELSRTITQVWDNMGRTAFEFAVMDQLLRAPGRQRVEIHGEENLDAAVQTQKPILFFGAHMGNWELLPVSTQLVGLSAHSFYRAPNNPLLQKLFTNRASRGEMIPKGTRGARRALALLKQNQHLGILVDQKLNDGIAVPFFGRDAMTGTALAEFALRFDAPMVPVRCERLPGARFKLTFLPALEVPPNDDKKAAVRHIMSRVNALLENWIRATPGQWLWLHNRWPKA